MNWLSRLAIGTIRGRIVTLVILVGAVLLSGGLYWYDAASIRLDQVQASVTQEKTRIAARVLTDHAKPLEAWLSHTSSIGDRELARTAHWGANAAWQMDRLGHVTESWPQRSSALGFQPAQLDKVCRIGGSTHFFAWTKDILNEVIVSSSQEGFTVATIPWTPEYRHGFTGLTGAIIGIDRNRGAVQKPNAEDQVPLVGISGKVIATANIDWSNVTPLEAKQATAASLAYFVTFACSCMLLFMLCLLITLGKPLDLIGKCLDQDRPDMLEEIGNDGTEIGRLARLVRDYFNQKEQIAQSAAELQELNAELEERIDERTEQLRSAIDSTIFGWSRAMDSKDHETEGHTQRVAQMSLRLAKALNVPEDDQLNLYRGALLHDIGKIGIPDSILLKPGSLTKEEFDVMKTHPVLAYEMLKPIEFLKDSLCVPHLHHEKWDGTGYPLGLAGEDIPFMARIFAVADVWDALRSDRPYRKGMPEEEVREFIAGQSGKHFDPQVVEAYLGMERMPHPNDQELDQAA